MDPHPNPPPPAASPPAAPAGSRSRGRHWLAPIASLRLTVVLFLLASILVFYGTIVQVDLPNFTTVDRYFRSFIIWIPARTLLFNLSQANLEALGLANFALPFPGGWLIGGVMMINLLAAHAIHFKMSWRRSGIVVIHAGIVLLMISEVITGVYALEGHMHIPTGTSVNYVQHNHLPEIVFTHPSEKKGKDVVAVVPKQYLHTGAVIDDPKLPCTLKIVQYMSNSNLLEILDPAWKNPATMGVGLDSHAIELPEVTGAGMAENKVDIPSAYVQLVERSTGKDLGTLLLTIYITRPEKITIGGIAYDVSLRFKRSYRPYSIFLKKFVHDNYVGTSKPKDFRAFIRFTDPTHKFERDDIEIYMNHPYRYEGETFYQSAVPEFDGTILQVVRNPGWTLPYIACLVVAAGMIVHFGLMLTKFVNARAKT
jgi:hypothetical protein